MTKKQALNKAIGFWVKASRDNVQIAKIMLNTGRYSFSMFMCQQAVEALLKGVFVIHNEERPPYIHKLPRLLELTGVKVPKDIDTKILRIDAHYIKARYKEDRFDRRIYNLKNAKGLIQDTEETLEWFVKSLKLGV